MNPITRLRYLNAKHGDAFVRALLVVGVFSLAVSGAVYLTPPTTEVTDHTNRQTVTTELATSVAVDGDSSAYANGTVLRNQPVYLTDVAPDPNVSVTTSFSDAPGDVSHRLSLVYTVTRGGETFWERTTPIPARTTAREGRTTTTASLSMSDVRTRLATYREEFGDAGTVAVAIRLSVEYSVDRYDGEFSETYPVTFGEGWYALESDTTTKSHSTPVTRTRAVPVTNRLPFVVPTGVGAVTTLAAGVGYFSRRRFALADGGEDVEGLVDRVHHDRYSEWVSEGTLPAADPESVVEMASLESLVDVAIDTGKRVVYDPTRERYAVIDGRVQYRYTPAVGAWEWGEDEAGDVT